jgi:transcriptional regulator with XRE-family HTH domain
MEPEGLGLRIRQRREALGLTMGQAAQRAGINKGTLSSIELYYVNRVPSALPAIARALETTPEHLLDGTPVSYAA